MYKIKSVEYSYLINIELKVLNHQNTFSSSSDSIIAFPVIDILLTDLRPKPTDYG